MNINEVPSQKLGSVLNTWKEIVENLGSMLIHWTII